MFQELPTQSEYFIFVDEKIFIDLRCRKGYTNEIEKLNKDDSDLTITIQLKTAATKKMRLCNWVPPRQILILNDKRGTHYELQRVWSKETKACK